MAPKADVAKKADAKAQALKTAKAVKTGSTFKKKAKKIRTKVTFHRPRTLKTDRNLSTRVLVLHHEISLTTIRFSSTR
ncbi:putative ribosomal protein L23/L25 [Helianthus annuus]|nr:putative ribosomal protein L23/L25 [Helianthus annuus]